MVIITIIVDKNDQVINFREPIGECPQHMRLLSCSLYTTWYNLKRPAEIMIFEDDNAKVKTLPARNYSLETLGRALEEVFKNEKINFRFDHVEPAIVISNPLQRKIQIDRDLVVSLGLIKYGIIEKPSKLTVKIIINQLTSFNTYLIHCDLIDRDENIFNGDPSSILASFDITGRPFERVTYSSEGTTMRKMKGLGHITSIRIKVTDENGDLIDFNGLPLKFEIEIV